MMTTMVVVYQEHQSLRIWGERERKREREREREARVVGASG